MAGEALFLRRLLAVTAVSFLLSSSSLFAADPEIGVWFGRATASKDVDVVRLAHRRALQESPRWWWPTHLQIAGGMWRVPDIRETTRRFDMSATPIWRAERGRVYFEAGIGAYLLSATINNDTTKLPSAFQFGSHIGAGIRLGNGGTAGLALQHLSNAGIKEPNGGIDFVMLTASFPL